MLVLHSRCSLAYPSGLVIKFSDFGFEANSTTDLLLILLHRCADHLCGHLFLSRIAILWSADTGNLCGVACCRHLCLFLHRSSYQSNPMGSFRLSSNASSVVCQIQYHRRFSRLSIELLVSCSIRTVSVEITWLIVPFFLHSGTFFAGFIPRVNAETIGTIVALIGATVMPHNLYLHSGLVQSRKIEFSNAVARKWAKRYNIIDVSFSLFVSCLINISIVIGKKKSVKH